MKLWFRFFIIILLNWDVCECDVKAPDKVEGYNVSKEDYEKWGLKEYGGRFSDPAAEAEEERHDGEILKAVIDSVVQWEIQKAEKHHSRSKRDEEMVCYQDVGCFRDEGPFDYLDMLPSSPEEIATKFLLFTRKNPGRPEILTYNGSNVLYNSTLPTKIIIHGFGSSCQHFWALEMRESLLSQIDCNVICVDWEKGAELPNYVRAAVNTRLVGRQVGLLLSSLLSDNSSSIHQFHLIGFSLGAHVTGFAGNAVLEMHNKLLPRITGLDPAGPLFESYSPEARLDSNDADFVDVIHSNGESLIMGGLGAWEQMGHVDFYPNGGRAQRGCSNLFWGSITDMFWWGSGRYIRKARELLNRLNLVPNIPQDARMVTESESRGLCNHRRAYKFFTNSIAPKCTFPSFQCETYEQFLVGDCFPCGAKGVKCANMGYYSDETEAMGKLYLVTREREPFCAHQFKVTLVSSLTQEPTYGKIEFIFMGLKGYNESFTLTRDDKEELNPGNKWTKILVPHPIVGENFKIEVRYTAYKGWLYSGTSTWTLEKVILMDSYGEISSYCDKPVELSSEESRSFHLKKGDCNPESTSWKSSSYKLSKPETPVKETSVQDGESSTKNELHELPVNSSRPHIYGFYANIRLNNKVDLPNKSPVQHPTTTPQVLSFPYPRKKLEERPILKLVTQNESRDNLTKEVHVIKLVGLDGWTQSTSPVTLVNDDVNDTAPQESPLDQIYIIFSQANLSEPMQDKELTRKWLLRPEEVPSGQSLNDAPSSVSSAHNFLVQSSPPPFQTRYYDIPVRLQNRFPQFHKSREQLRIERPSISHRQVSRTGKILRFFTKSVESLPFLSSHFGEQSGSRSSRSQLMEPTFSSSARELRAISDSHINRYIPLTLVNDVQSTDPSIKSPMLSLIPKPR